MQIEVTIKALFDPLDTAEHDAMADALVQMLVRAPKGLVPKVELPPEAQTEMSLTPPSPVVAAAPPKRTRAAKPNGKAASADPIGDTGGIGDTGDTDDAGLGLAPADDEVSDEELKQMALARLRSVWAKPGGAEKVKALQKQYKLAKFADMPAKRAAEVLAAANTLARELGIRG